MNFSEKRKEQQQLGLLPDWYSTAGYQMVCNKYLHKDSVKEQYETIAKTLAAHVEYKKWGGYAEEKFFELLWKGWLSPSTPILANAGTKRGDPVSCSGGYIDDSIDGFYSARRETALLTKHGFGTSGYLGDIRPRGSSISIGSSASGILPVFKGFVRDMQEVAQGATRRGAWAGYLPIMHGDFDELCDYLHHSPDDLNVGWTYGDKFVEALDTGDAEALRRWRKLLKVKMITGKGYLFGTDKANRLRPDCYKDRGLDIKSSNLCTEIMLHSSNDYTFTCVLSSMNVAKYDEWKDTDAVYYATIFLHCVALDFIQRAKGRSGFEKSVAFTEKSMALGLGQCGFHTYLQDKMIPYESLEARYRSNEIAKYIREEAEFASQQLADAFGEPEWCEGTGKANSHLIAIAPTKSTALIMGGVSEGINPDPAMVYTQTTSAGEVTRISPAFLKLLKEKKLYNEQTIKSITENFGSVQHLEGLDDHERLVFRTAFEIDQLSHLRMCGLRQTYLDQTQSINLFFAGDATEERVSEAFTYALKHPNIPSIYYAYSQTGVSGSNDCVACQ